MLWTAGEPIISFLPFVDSYIFVPCFSLSLNKHEHFRPAEDVDGATDTILVIDLAGRPVYLRTIQTFEIREQTESTLGHQAA
jgi:hypothetical protein